MARSSEAGRTERWRLADELLEVARVDTAYADLYVERARELLGAEMTEAQLEAARQLDAEVPELQNRIANAMEVGEWHAVRDLTGRLADLKRSISERQGPRALAERAYGAFEPLVDAFSPGIHGLAGIPERGLPALRDQGLRRLERLRDADSERRGMYEARRAALAALKLGAGGGPVAEGERAGPGLRTQAQAALASGDLARLQQLAAQLATVEEAALGGAQSTQPGGSAIAAAPPDLDCDFDVRAREGAERLGLAACRVPSTFETVRDRYRPSWRPTASTDATGSTVRLSVTMPPDTPAALRETLQAMMNRPFVTSAGTRYVPSFVAEDLLLEDFEDAALEAAPGDLLAALGLPARRGLSRRRIEEALRARGGGVVAHLGLDPVAFRLVCIPLDVYTRLASAKGWGTRELWTHFDGYVATRTRRLMALAGGDVRFGGVHDLVAVGPDYDSDRLVARFAVVQRRRFSSW